MSFLFKVLSFYLVFFNVNGEVHHSVGLQKFSRNLICKDQLFREIDRSLVSKVWTPIAVSIPDKPLAKGIQFFDSRSQVLYKIFSVEEETTFTKENFVEKVLISKSFNKKDACKTHSKRSKLSQVGDSGLGGFTDSELHKIIIKNKWGVFYFWTPSMPLSILGITEIRAAVKAKGGKLTVLVDPKASEIEIQNLVLQKRVLSTDIVRATSDQLNNLDINLHYPGILVFKDKKISNRSYLGYKKQTMYKMFIDEELHQIEKGIF